MHVTSNSDMCAWDKNARVERISGRRVLTPTTSDVTALRIVLQNEGLEAHLCQVTRIPCLKCNANVGHFHPIKHADWSNKVCSKQSTRTCTPKKAPQNIAMPRRSGT